MKGSTVPDMTCAPPNRLHLHLARRVCSTLLGAMLLLAACQPSPAAPTTAPVAKATLAEAAKSAAAPPPASPAAAQATAEPAMPGKPAASTKSTLVIAQSTDAISLDPQKHTTYPTQNVLWHIYEPLVSMDAAGAYHPALATAWQIVNDTTWQFKLRPNVKFHNGDSLTAEDVKFTFDRALNPDTRNPTRANLTQIERVDVVDSLTVNFVTKGAYPVLPYRLSENSFSSLIIPSKYVKEKGNDILASQPIGTGPYKFASHRKDERLELEANADYWGGAPAINKVVFRPIPETAARIAELRSGGADLVVNVPPEQVSSLSSGSTKVDTTPSNFVMMVVFNTLDEGPLRNKDVRQALNYAVDVDAIVKNIMGGLAQRIAVALPREGVGYPKDLQPYPYDPKRAREMLAAAGFPNGFKVPFISRSGRYLKDKEVVETVAGYLQKVGVETELRLVEPGVWAQLSDRKGREGLSYPGWSGPDAELVWSNILVTGQLQSYFSNAELDGLLEQGRNTLDQTKRLEAYSRAAALIKEEAPHIPLFQPPLIFARNEKLAWIPRGDEIIDLRTATFK
jgi:peptide/nickel transport system substrate-binding protein